MQIPKSIRNKYLLFAIGKLGYLRNKLNLSKLTVINKGRFYIYRVNGFSLASESFSWFLHKGLLQQDVAKVSAKFYQPRAGDTVLDIGAGLGEETCIYSELVGAHGHVYAIEANPMVHKVLQEVVKRNDCANVQVFNVALNEKAAPVVIDDAAESYLSSSLNNITKGTLYEVPGLPLHEFCATHGIQRIDLLKVNIEGAERFLVDSFGRPDLDIRQVAISCHDFRYAKEGNPFFQTKDLIRQCLLQHGYEIFEQQTGMDYVDDWVYGTKRSAFTSGS